MITVDTHTKVHSSSSSPAFGNAMLQAAPLSEVYLMDCIQGMKYYPDKWFDLAIVDPPYGLGDRLTNGSSSSPFIKQQAKKVDAWDIVPKNEYWNELFRVSKNQIVWGGNYFCNFLGAFRGFIYWDKTIHGNSYSDGELAWTSFDKPSRYFRQNIAIITSEGRIHPTQKSIALYDFCFEYAKVEARMKVLDTHLGSQSSRISANKYQLNFVGFETDEEYFNKGNKRYDDFVSQTRLF